MDLRPEGQPGWWKPLGVERKASDVSPFKKRIPALCSLALCSAWKSRFLKLLAAITSGRVSNTEPTLRQISEETLESLKLRERNFKHRTTPEQPVKPTEGHPQEWRHATTTGRIPSTSGKRKTSASFQLKSKVSNNLYSAELVELSPK